MLLIGAATDAVTMADAVDLPVMYVGLSSRLVIAKMFTSETECTYLEQMNTVSSPGNTNTK